MGVHTVAIKATKVMLVAKMLKLVTLLKICEVHIQTGPEFFSQRVLSLRRAKHHS